MLALHEKGDLAKMLGLPLLDAYAERSEEAGSYASKITERSPRSTPQRQQDIDDEMGKAPTLAGNATAATAPALGDLGKGWPLGQPVAAADDDVVQKSTRKNPPTPSLDEANVDDTPELEYLGAARNTSWPGQAEESHDFPPREFDDYRLIRELGRGGMGQVHLALDTVLDRHVAIKFIARSSEARRARFLNEARVLSRFRHPNIVIAYQFGQLDDQPYLVMEYIRGRSLRDLPMPMPWREVRKLCLPVLSALTLAHRHRVLHRDIKPSNILIAENGEPMLTDFGLAKRVSEPEPESDSKSDAEPDVEMVTAEGALVGTPHYIAPECWLGEVATPRSDVYAFGVLLYELCSGSRSLRAGTYQAAGPYHQ